MLRKKWTSEEKQLLREKYEVEGLGYGEIAVLLGRTHFSVQVCSKRMRLRHSHEQEMALRSRIHIGSLNPMYGHIGPNRGLTKENSQRVLDASQKLSQTRKQLFIDGKLPDTKGCKNPMWGKPSWCAGKTKLTDLRLFNGGVKGSNTRKKMWAALPEDEKERRRILWGSQWKKNRRGNKHRTSIEVTVQSWLEELNINFDPQVQIGRWTVDFFIPDFNTAIECDGDYWHCNPLIYDRSNADHTQKRNIDRDAKKDLFLSSSGIKILRIWETDICNGKGKTFLDQLVRERHKGNPCV